MKLIVRLVYVIVLRNEARYREVTSAKIINLLDALIPLFRVTFDVQQIIPNKDTERQP